SSRMTMLLTRHSPNAIATTRTAAAVTFAAVRVRSLDCMRRCFGLASPARISELPDGLRESRTAASDPAGFPHGIGALSDSRSPPGDESQDVKPNQEVHRWIRSSNEPSRWQGTT